MIEYRSFVGAILLVGTFTAAVSALQPEKDDKAMTRQRIEAALAKLVKGEGDWKKLSMTYSDLHPFHGGLTLTIDGSGKVTQQALREKVGEEREVSKQELKRLVELLQSHKAWEQKVPARLANPDESKARFTIKYGDDVVEVWEWYNDLRKNKRIVELREAMKTAAWKEVPKK